MGDSYGEIQCSLAILRLQPRLPLTARPSPPCRLTVAWHCIVDGQIANPAQVLPSVYQSAQALFGSGANKAGQPLALKIAAKTIPGAYLSGEPRS